jgi:hypothetical protein
LTKGLPKKPFDNITSKLSMEDIFKPAWGGVLQNIIINILVNIHVPYILFPCLVISISLLVSCN